VIDPTRHPRLLMHHPGREVTAAEVDRLSRVIERQKVGDSLCVRVTLNYLALDKRLRSAAPAAGSNAIVTALPPRQAAENAEVAASVVGEEVSISASTPTAIARS
jgi:hypothetical protein